MFWELSILYIEDFHKKNMKHRKLISLFIKITFSIGGEESCVMAMSTTSFLLFVYITENQVDSSKSSEIHGYM